MSLAPIHSPTQIFTSTMTDHHISSFNVWIILLTAILFFTVLAWFNFVLAFYGTLVSSTRTKRNTNNQPTHTDETLSTLGFAIVWTVVAIVMYYAMEWAEVLGTDRNNTNREHPLIPNEGRVSTDISGIGIGDYIGGI